MPLSVAAACNSKLKVRQKRLRSDRPQARLMREPKGACSTNCMPPRFIEESFGDHGRCDRQRAQRRRAGLHIERWPAARPLHRARIRP